MPVIEAAAGIVNSEPTKFQTWVSLLFALLAQLLSGAPMAFAGSAHAPPTEFWRYRVCDGITAPQRDTCRLAWLGQSCAL